MTYYCSTRILSLIPNSHQIGGVYLANASVKAINRRILRTKLNAFAPHKAAKPEFLLNNLAFGRHIRSNPYVTPNY